MTTVAHARLSSHCAKAGERMLYLDTSPDATFAVAHLPGDVRSSTGVIFCPLFGWEDICTHRSRRRWAQSLAAAGHAAIRLDLPGTGDSSGDPGCDDRLESWVDAVSAAAAWLREEAGCTTVCALGIGFGGMIAWLAAADGAPVDDLLLWGVPTRGRRLVRQVRAGAMLSIDRRVSAVDPISDDHAPDDASRDDASLLDEAGQLTAPETVAAISAIDLRDTALPDPERRRALVLAREGDDGDASLADHLRTCGVAVTVGNGDSLDELMRYVQQSSVGPDVLRATLDWLGPAAAMPAGEPVQTVRRSVPPAGMVRHATQTVRHRGVTVRETAVSLGQSSGTITGILSEPGDDARADVCVVFFGGGSDRRIGPNRMWVEVARRACAHGAAALRLDPSGVGDSDGDEREWDRVRQHYRPIHVTRTSELLDTLAQSGLPGRFVLVGFCSGAYRSLHAAERDPRVVGVVALGLPFFRWTWWAATVRESWVGAWEPKAEDSTAKIRLLGTLQRGLRAVLRAHHGAVRLSQGLPNRGERMISRLDQRGVELMFLLKPRSYAHEQLFMPSRRTRLDRMAHVQVLALPGDDQRFRPLVSQRLVNESVDQALERLITRASAPSR